MSSSQLHLRAADYDKFDLMTDLSLSFPSFKKKKNKSGLKSPKKTKLIKQQ
jgi:hypothetical protein